jgi:hypothetical protein
MNQHGNSGLKAPTFMLRTNKAQGSRATNQIGKSGAK